MSEQDTPMFTGALVVTATATAVHPEGAQVPGVLPADAPDSDEE